MELEAAIPRILDQPTAQEGGNAEPVTLPSADEQLHQAQAVLSQAGPGESLAAQSPQAKSMPSCVGPCEMSLVHPASPTAQVPDEEQYPWTPMQALRSRRTPFPAKDSASADRRFKGFAFKVRKPRAPPILQLPTSELIASSPKPVMPLRSRRIAAQSLSRIPASKRGEFLVLKRLGHAPDPADQAAVEDSYDALFGGEPEDAEALQALFHDDQAVGGRKRRRRQAPVRA